MGGWGDDTVGLRENPTSRTFVEHLGCSSFTAITRVQIPSGTPLRISKIRSLSLKLRRHKKAQLSPGSWPRGQLQHIGINGKATGENPALGGETTGGLQVIFDNNEIFSRDIAAKIRSDERVHGALLRSALGIAAVAKPNIDLNALGIGFGSQADFLTVARILEDIGATAYSLHQARKAAAFSKTKQKQRNPQTKDDADGSVQNGGSRPPKDQDGVAQRAQPIGYFALTCIHR
jgi:hypothetical protein